MANICFTRVGETAWHICGHEGSENLPFIGRVRCNACKVDGRIRRVDGVLDERYIRLNQNRS